MGAGGIERIAAVFVVDQHAEAGAALSHLCRSPDGKHLEGRDAREQFRISLGNVLELTAMVDGERHQERDVAPSRRRPVHVVDCLVLAQRLLLAAVLEEILQFGPGRDFRRAEQARDREGAAGIGPGSGRRVRLAGEPAAQKA